MSIRSMTAQALFRINPYWDEISWNRRLDREAKSQDVRIRRTKRARKFNKRPFHLVVVPQDGPSGGTYSPGKWNFYFEADRIITDEVGPQSVSVLDVKPDESTESWHLRLIDLVRDTHATHVLTHIESDPGGAGDSWTWDQAFARLLDSGWDGALLGVSFDSAFKWISARSRRLAKMSPQFVAVDICMPLDGQLVKGRPEVGPVNMPVSRLTLEMVAHEIANVQKEFDVSFIGALYPYRVKLIDAIRLRGINVAVNPHRSDETKDFSTSRSNQPSWLQYMHGLASSHITINFSQSSAGPFEQLKTRVLEATLAGTFLLTDDQDRTRLFFSPDQFATFKSIDELPDLIEKLLSDRNALSARARDAQLRAQKLAVSNFWDGIDKGLRQRGLPSIFE